MLPTNYLFRFLRDDKRALGDQVEGATFRGGAGKAAGDVPDRAPGTLEPCIRRWAGMYTSIHMYFMTHSESNGDAGKHIKIMLMKP